MFPIFNFETDFVKNENHFQKTGETFFSWKYDDSKRIISYKTAMSEAHVKTNEITNVITRNGILPVTTLIFWKFCFSLRTSWVDLMYQLPKCPYSYFP